MGWENCHLHSFEIGREQYGTPDPGGWGPEIHDEKKYTIERLAAVKARFRYTYDFGDDWHHDIVVEKVTPGEPTAPRCIAGARACPPEDCGGAWGYMELVEAISAPQHPRHDELADRLPSDWAAERFDLAAADRLVATHRPAPGRPRPKASKRGGTRARA